MKKGAKILIVEDNQDIQTLYKDILKNTYDITIVDNAFAATDKLRDEKYDLMILDIILPDKGGDSFLAEIKKKPEFKDLKVMVVTVLGDVKDQIAASDPDATCLAKPFTKEQLLDEINSTLSKS